MSPRGLEVLAVLPVHPETGPREADLAERVVTTLGMAVVWHVDAECFVCGVLMGSRRSMATNIQAISLLEAFRPYEYAEA